jgi:hypothetical protein
MLTEDSTFAIYNIKILAVCLYMAFTGQERTDDPGKK